MDMYEFFACFTKLPILIDTVRDQALRYGAVDKFRFVKTDTDPTVLRGKLQMFQETGDDGKPETVARIFYSRHIPDSATRRLVCCKEILHIFDSDAETARSLEAVDGLIESIVIPPDVDVRLANSTWSDHLGCLHALMILLPRGALDILKEKIVSGELSVADVARLADIPDTYARLALSPVWEKITDKID